MPQHPRVPFTITRGATSYYVFQYIIEKIFSKCRQNSYQIAMGSPLGAAIYFSFVGYRKPKRVGMNHWFRVIA